MPEELTDEVQRKILRLVDDRVRDLFEEKEGEESRNKIAHQKAFEERWKQHRLASEKREELEL
tara:strand:+ start:746 stop:934 length:189 start_codon:yes stop_codon:yes gene_type:complete